MSRDLAKLLNTPYTSTALRLLQSIDLQNSLACISLRMHRHRFTI